MSTLTLTEKRNRNTSTAITFGFHALLLLLFFLVKINYDQIKQEEDGGGMLINFGDAEAGSGDIIPEGTEASNPNASLPNNPNTDEINNVATQNIENADAVKINKKEKPKDKPKETIIKPKSNSTTVIAPVKEKPVEKPKAIFSGTKNNGVTSQGNNPNGTSDQGKPNGSPFSNGKSDIGGGTNPDGIGGPGGGITLNLAGRSIKKYPTVTDNSQKTGKVVVNIKVDKTGKVIYAKATRQGSTTDDSYLFNLAEKAAYQTQLNVASNMVEQFGTMTFNFKVK